MRDKPWTIVLLLTGVATLVCGFGITIAIIKTAPPPPTPAPHARFSFAAPLDLSALYETAAPEGIDSKPTGGGEGNASYQDDARTYLTIVRITRSHNRWLTATPDELQKLPGRLQSEVEKLLREWNAGVEITASHIWSDSVTVNYRMRGPVGSFEGKFEARLTPLPVKGDEPPQETHAVRQSLEMDIEEGRWGVDPLENPG